MKFVNNYRPKESTIKAMFFDGSEKSVNNAKKFAGKYFAIQSMPGRYGTGIRFLLKTRDGWEILNPGKFICLNEHTLFIMEPRLFRDTWEETPTFDELVDSE